jgi:hypothetical protein
MERFNSVTTCAHCKRHFTGPGITYKNKKYCNFCYADAMLKDDPIIKCAKCKKNVKSSFTRIYKGDRICPHCLAIKQHEAIAFASGVHRAAIKARLSAPKKAKTGTYDPDWMFKTHRDIPEKKRKR